MERKFKNRKKDFLIVLIAGGSCSGKSSLAKKFVGATIVSLDDFYIGKSRMIPDKEGNYNFDEPKVVDLEECVKAIRELSKGNATLVPNYDMVVSERVGTKKLFPPKNKIIIVEGIFALYSPLKELGDLKIFIDTPIEQRVARRIVRDVGRGRSAIETIRWSINVEEAYEKYVAPTKRYADLILGHENW